ncbi:HAD hydrolase, family IE [Phytophthora nicotianae INRA-310]|uniref:5'-nucleotidase n=3 Tax=Phytophthora nicotianae TaxID=4792 RepID=W2QN30_PHYN3|nr:HAD hydrolase, family IE [Phytophthora nicotianae INRA-310]ETN13655.1 HAD hydrolase, family IE [Phytophthora nicotianae INRA-310]
MIVGDPDAFARKMKKFTQDGADQLLVIADFDRTLTPYYKQRRDPQAPLEQESSSHGLLMTSSVLQPQVCAGEQELFARFYPVEMSPTLSAAEKLPFMEQWWNSAHALLVEYKLTKDQVEQAVALGSLSFRHGFHPLFKLLNDQQVPTLIFSAGLYDVIHAALEREFTVESKRNGSSTVNNQTSTSSNLLQRHYRRFHPLFKLLNDQQVPTLIFSAGLYDVIHAALEREFTVESKRNGSSTVNNQTSTSSNVHVVSNMMRFDTQGVIEGFEGKLIHSLNKNARVLLDSPFWEECQLEKRRNVLLLGDSPGDTRMAEGLNADEIIRVGFLNVHVDEKLDEYLDLYDVVFTHDASLVPVQMLIEQMTVSSKAKKK